MPGTVGEASAAVLAGRVIGEAKADAAAADCRKTWRRLDVDGGDAATAAAVGSTVVSSSKLFSSTPLVMKNAVTVRTEDEPEPR